MKLSNIKKNPNNPRIIRDEKFRRLQQSLKDFPQMMELRPIIVDGGGVILGGNMRFEALKANGLVEIPDAWVKRADELTEEQKREFIIKDNAGFGEWDWDQLANEWDDCPLTAWGLDLPEDWKADAPPVEEDESAVSEMADRAAELQQKWQVRGGDLWEIGRHRLLCGDSTRSADVERLLGGASPNLMVTDPPYGVEYNAEWRNHALQVSNRAVGKVTNDHEGDWTPAWQLFPGNVVYCWHAGRHASVVQASLEVAGFEMRSQIIWAKSNFAVSRGHYHWKHEPCWYAVRRGANASWIGDHSQTSLWEIDKPMKSETGHSTQKPVECMERPIRNHEGHVYDPFVGSGTTIVAAERLGRTCYAMELAETYCAVILERMSALGLTPKLLDNVEENLELCQTQAI